MMYQLFLTLHSLNRWLVLLFLIYGIYLSARGYLLSLIFGTRENFVRHFTATLGHIQLLLGLSLYMISPIVKSDSGIDGAGLWLSEHVFFKFIHISLMALSVVLLTIGSAKAKRAERDRAKFKTMLIFFLLALMIILLAIPWPFSPLSNRPLLRTF